MVKTPEQYFQDQDFGAPNATQSDDITAAEHAFLQKYVGVDGAHELGIMLGEGCGHIPDVPPLEEELKDKEQLQMIFVYLQGQLYAIPIEAVQEVLNYMQPIRLPLSPDFMAGIINLRGRVTPLLHLEQMLCAEHSDITSDSFIVICHRKGIQVGMVVDKIQTMKTVNTSDISWNVEAQIGANAEYICGILDYDDKVFGILSIDRIVDYILQI